MANELIYDGDLHETGLTLVSRVYSASGAQIGSDVAMTESGALAIYSGDMPTPAPQGFYSFRVVDSNGLLRGRGEIDWDGIQERLSSTHSASDVYSEFTSGTNEDVFKADLSGVVTTLNTILADTDELQQNQGNWLTATGFSTHSAADIWTVASRTLTSIPAATLTPAERASIATAVEQAILNEGDGEQVLNAIVGAIGNTNVNEVALVAAIRADLERAGGAIEGVSNQVTGLNDLSTADVKAQADQALVDGDVATTANQTTITANQTVIINAITALNNLSPVDLQAALTTYGVATSTNVSDIETSLQAALAVIEGKVDVVDGIVDGIDLSGAKQALSQAIQDTVNDLDLELDGLASASALADVASKLNEVWQIHGLDPSSVLIVTKQQRSVGTIMQEITGDCVNNSQIERTM